MLEQFKSILNDPLKEVKTSDIYIDKDKTKFHPEGLFSEQIFGPVKDYMCQCGELKGYINKGKRCPKCNVLCESSILRYKEFGYIKLPTYVLYPFVVDKVIKKIFAKNVTLLKRMLNGLLSTDKWLFFNKKTNKLMLVPELKVLEEYSDLLEYNMSIQNLFKLLVIEKRITVDEYERLNDEYLLDYPVFGIFSLYRLYNSEYFRNNVLSKLKKNKKIEEYLDVVFINKILVPPPEIRPYIKLNNKTILHELTKKLILILNAKNNVIFKDINVDDVLNKEDITLSELYYLDLVTTRLQKYITEYYNMIIEQIHGKTGKIRQYIHGKTIDFSARCVVVPDISIKPYEINIPYNVAKEVLFPYFINYTINEIQNNPTINKLFNNYDIQSFLFKIIALQQGMISENELDYVEKEILERFFKNFIDEINNNKREYYAILNRAPTLWIHNFHAFNIKVKYEKEDTTIGVHPLMVEMQNMDHDGDSVIAHVNLRLKLKETDEIFDYKTHISKVENLTLKQVVENGKKVNH